MRSLDPAEHYLEVAPLRAGSGGGDKRTVDANHHMIGAIASGRSFRNLSLGLGIDLLSNRQHAIADRGVIEEMNVMIKPAPVRTSITVDAPLARAFEVFTSGFGRWWPATHSIGKSPIKTAIIEPRVGGRWYEIGEDGSECEWGEVLVWEPPSRVLLAWRIGIDWQFDPKLLTEVDIRFAALGEDSTRVELEHRLLENMGETAERAREIFGSDGGWPGLLANYWAEVGKSAAL